MSPWPALAAALDSSQMSRLLHSIRELIESGPLAHLVTLNPDGSPQVTVVWIGIEDDEIVSGHLFRHRKVENILRDPRVALSLEAPGANEIGMRNYAVVYGQAWITEGGAPELLQRLAYIYVGPGVTFPPMPDPRPGYITRIRVERVTGQGAWADDR
jgi:PPOX class probable F420-dependent enzyme